MNARPSRVCDQLLVLLTDQPQPVHMLEPLVSCSKRHLLAELSAMRHRGLVERAGGSGVASLTLRGLSAQMRLTGEECIFPPDFQSPAVSIMLRLKQAGWEGQLFVDGERHHLPISRSINELAQAAETFLQERET